MFVKKAYKFLMKKFETKFSKSDRYWFHTVQETLPDAEIINWRANIILATNLLDVTNPDTEEDEKILKRYIAAYLEMGMDLDSVKMYFLE